MDALRLESFTVGGQPIGTIQLPCDGATSVNIEIRLSGRLTSREAPGPVSVPIWIGEHRKVGFDKTLIEGYLVFQGAARTPQTSSEVYLLLCSAACTLTPWGRLPAWAIVLPPWFPPVWPPIVQRLWKLVLLEILNSVYRFMTWLWPPFFAGKTPVTYRVDGREMTLTAAYYDRSQPFLFRWYYSRNKIRVECMNSLTTVNYISPG
jgi:hypothetical protein